MRRAGPSAAMRPSPWERENAEESQRVILAEIAAMRPSPWERENFGAADSQSFTLPPQ